MTMFGNSDLYIKIQLDGDGFFVQDVGLCFDNIYEHFFEKTKWMLKVTVWVSSDFQYNFFEKPLV